MSRAKAEELDAMWGFPRVSGDEPRQLAQVDWGITFSPRERG